MRRDKLKRQLRTQGSGLRTVLVLLFLISELCSLSSPSWAKYEQEQVAMETNLQQKIETILSKTLPPNSYLVTVKVEMEEQVKNAASGGQRREKGNPFLNNKKFVLPGVPQQNQFSDNNNDNKDATPITVTTVESLVKKITITILVAPDIPAEKIKSVRDLLNESLPFNPLRGDELVIRPDSIINSTGGKADEAAALETTAGSSTTSVTGEAPSTGSLYFWKTWRTLSNSPQLPQWIITGFVFLAVVVFLIFLLGPVRAFLNRLLVMLPRVGETAALNARDNGNGTQNGNAQNGVSTDRLPYLNGNDPANGSDHPFHFIRPEQLSKLPVVLKTMTPAQTALVLAYLPAEWASQVMATLDPAIQSSVIRELSHAKEIPADTVRELEQQIKEKLPYWVGGADWVQAVYQMTQPHVQRTLLGAISQQSPDLAQTLRRKSFFFEDLPTLDTAALRLLTQEAGYPVIAAALRDERPEMGNAVLAKLPAAMRTIVMEELELSKDDKPASADAKTRVMAIARRLINEGRLKLPEKGR